MDFDKKKPSSEFVQETLKRAVKKSPETLKLLSDLRNFLIGDSHGALLDELLV